MAEIVNEDSGGRSVDEISNREHSPSGEVLAEWRSSDQVENGTTSTSPLYWDTDNEDDDYGPKPSELYGKYTWRIDEFSETNKRELRSNAFEVGGYRWYILIYPQGCDVCNHLSLFLCVANHDKLLPGWSHFAQFTIAVVNKDPKKSKYSDTLHRFWKKEHDWGWKKFMELPKLQDGFIDDSDCLIIKAQVQVISERADRPFRCLDRQYRRELVRVYLTNVEQICRCFVEERRSKLGRLIEDKARWSSFCAFWLGMDQHSRRLMSREKMDVILKVVVKHFFIEKEVTSTLVMDSLYSGLKALEGQTKNKKSRTRLLDAEEMPAPIVSVEKDMFVLVDDVLLLLERAALEPLPPKDDKGPQNRTKDGNLGEDFNKEAIERDERRLTELGRRTVEMFVLAHIFSNKIEVAYQEAIALKRQEELIREEEAAWLAESEQKAKRVAADKEKKSKKKQAKQKRNKSKGKDKRREDKVSSVTKDMHHEENHCSEQKDTVTQKAELVLEKPETFDDVSDVSDSVDGSAEILRPDSEDRNGSPINWDADISKTHHLPTEGSTGGISGLLPVPTGVSDKKSQSAMDDSSSTCSNDSVPPVLINGSCKVNSLYHQNQRSPSRTNNSRGKLTSSLASETDDRLSTLPAGAENHNHVSESSKTGDSESMVAVTLSHDPKKLSEQHPVKKEANLLQKKPNVENSIDTEQPKEKNSDVASSPESPLKNLSLLVQSKSDNKTVPNVVDAAPIRKPLPNGPQISDQASSLPSGTLSPSMGPKFDSQKAKPTENPRTQPTPMISRPSSAPLIPPPRRAAPAVSVVQTNPLLASSVSSAGRSGPEPLPSIQSYVPQSYRNAIVGNPVSSSGFTNRNCPSHSAAYSQPPLISAPYESGFPFDVVNRDVLPGGTKWKGNLGSQRDTNISLNHDIRDANQYLSSGFHDRTTCGNIPSGRPTQGVLTDEFPHLDIINDLLEDEHASNGVMGGSAFHVPQLLNYPHTTFPGTDLGMSSGEMLSRMFDRLNYRDDSGVQQAYSHFDSLGEFIPDASSLPYGNGNNDGFVPSQWQSAGLDLSLLAMRNSDADGYPFFGSGSLVPNVSGSFNGYTEFRPSNRR